MTERPAKGAEGPDYATDVPYLRTFSGDLSPALLRLVAALNGFTPPPTPSFDYCELGAGNGDTTAALAAANPRARFVGVDVSPEHAAFGSGLARRGEIDNLRFLALDFADLGRADLPDFDFIAAHGVLSWVSPEMRRTMIEVASAKLKPGGLLYVSYNALPGWAAVEPLRRLMIESAAGASGSSIDLDSTAFGTLLDPAQFQREIRLPHRTLRFDGPVFDALIPALLAGAKTLAELALLPALAAVGAAGLREAILLLLVGGQVIPMARSSSAPGRPGTPGDGLGLERVPLAYNGMMLGQRLSPENPIILASPEAGTAMILSQLEAISLRLLTEVVPAARPAWIRALVARQPLRLRVGDRWIADDDADTKVHVLSEQLAHFCANRLPKLQELGIVEPSRPAQEA